MCLRFYTHEKAARVASTLRAALLRFQAAAADLRGAARSRSPANALVEALTAEFDVPDRRSTKRKRDPVAWDNKRNLVNKWKAKARGFKATMQCLVRAKHAWRISNLWRVKIATSPPSVPCRTFERFCRDFPTTEVQNVSATSISITRDAFAEALKKVNRDVIAVQSRDASRILNRDGQETPCFVVVHVHDEAAMKVKSFEFDGSLRPELQNKTVGRYSKVQNQSVCVHFGQAQVPVLTELRGMSVKDAPTIAECLIQVTEHVVRAITDGCPRATARIVHLMSRPPARLNTA